MIINKDLSKNLRVLSCETLFYYGDTLTPSKLRFKCVFFGEIFHADIPVKNIEQNQSSIEAEGCSELFDSFEEQIEEQHWETIVDLSAQHLKEAAEQQ